MPPTRSRGGYRSRAAARRPVTESACASGDEGVQAGAGPAAPSAGYHYLSLECTPRRLRTRILLLSSHFFFFFSPGERLCTNGWHVIPIPKKQSSSSAREPPMGAAQSLEASPPSSPEEHRPPRRPEPAWEASRGATSRPPASVARHASPQRRVAWGTPQSAKSRMAATAASESQGARGAYRRELLQASAGTRPASELAAATTSAAPAARRAAVAGSLVRVRVRVRARVRVRVRVRVS